MTIFGREPVVWVGILVAVAIGIIQTLTGQGVLGDATAGKAIDITNAIGQILTFLVPVIVGIIAARQQVTPTAAPTLDKGTTVTVTSPGDAPDTRTVL